MKRIGGFMMIGSGTEVWLLGWLTTIILILSSIVVGYLLWKLLIAYARHKTKAELRHNAPQCPLEVKDGRTHRVNNANPDFKTEVTA